MTVSQRSRYLAANQVVVEASSDALPNRGNSVTLYTPPVVFERAPYARYQVIQGETYQLIADRMWGDAGMWWRIADANPQIFFPDDLKPGDIIRLPLL